MLHLFRNKILLKLTLVMLLSWLVVICSNYGHRHKDIQHDIRYFNIVCYGQGSWVT